MAPVAPVLPSMPFVPGVPCNPCKPVAPVSPLSPFGIVNVKVCDGIPFEIVCSEIVTVACVPAKPVTVGFTAIIFAGPGPPNTPSTPLGILKLNRLLNY